MRGSDLEVVKGENIAEVDSLQSGSQSLGLKRDPSFSNWCDEDGNFHFHQLEDPDTRHQNENFELPLLQLSESKDRFLEKGGTEYSISGKENMHPINGKDLNREPLHSHEYDSEEYVPFDIENGSSSGKSFLNVSVDGSDTASNFEMFSASEKSTFSVANVVKTIILILMWYTFSTFLTLYNKTLLGDHLGKFPAPLLMTAIHFGMQAVFSRIIIRFWLPKSQSSIKMSWRDYFLRVVPTALGTALDVDLSNVSLVFISVTFATMCKSAAPIFLLLFAFGFRLEHPSFKLLGIILIISVGVLLAVAKETEFDLWGFIFVLLAAVMSGFRWCMTQLLLQKESYGLKNPFMLMSYVAPVMAIVTVIFSLFLDPWHEFKKDNYFNSSWHITRSCLLMLLGGILAFVMVLTEYILVSATSAVTVTIAGVVKEAVTIVVAVFYFHDEFTWLKGLGLVTIMIGVSLFNWYKYLKLQQGKENKGGVLGSDAVNTAGRYVILDETDDQEDDN